MTTQLAPRAGRVVLLASLAWLTIQATSFAQIAPPYTENFDTFATCGTSFTTACPLSGGWTNLTTDNQDWLPDANGTPSSGTGPSVDHTTGTGAGQYLYTEATGGVLGSVAIVRSPLFDAFSITDPRIGIWYHMLGGSMGDLHLDVVEYFNAGTDGVTSGTTFQALNSANFTAAHIGSQIVISGSAAGNDGSYTILAVSSNSTVTVDIAFPAAETGLTYSHETVHPDVTPSVTDNIDLWQQIQVQLTSVLVRQGTIEQFQVQIRGVRGDAFTNDMAIDDFSYDVAPALDMATLNIVTPLETTCPGASTVSISIANNGTISQSNVPVQYQIDGGAPVIETFVGPILPGNTATYAFATTATLTSGSHTVAAATLLAGDLVPGNDTASATTATRNAIAALPYADDFETATNDWTASGFNSTWALGSPSKSQINGTTSGANAWVTGGLTGQYNVGELSFLTGPCFDFSAVANPAIHLKIWWETEFSWDGLSLQSSIDGGATWQLVGAFGDSSNWYNDNSIGSQALSNPTLEGWSGSALTGGGSGGYVTAAHLLDGLAGQSEVILRFAFTADGSVQDEGVAIDDIAIIDFTNLYPGSNEDLILETGVNDVATTALAFGSSIKQTTFTDLITVRISSPQGSYDNFVFNLLGQFFMTGTPPTKIDALNYPEVHINLGAFVITPQFPLAPTVAPGGSDFYFYTPGPALVGNSVLIQGLATNNAAANGFFAITDGLEFAIN
ncbi:MAG: hypothetical protein KDB53_16825 [Planctomycetes bacterium]|nr:hypothetical protein [Planctomycetota bacterium]